MNLIQFPSYFLNTDFNFICTSMPRSSKWSVSHRFPRQNSVCPFLLPHTCHMSYPSHSPETLTPDSIWSAVQIMKLNIMQVSPYPFTYPHILFSNTLSVWDQVSHPYTAAGKITVMYVLIYISRKPRVRHESEFILLWMLFWLLRAVPNYLNFVTFWGLFPNIRTLSHFGGCS